MLGHGCVGIQISISGCKCKWTNNKGSGEKRHNGDIETAKGPSGFLYTGYNMVTMDKPFKSRERNNELAVKKNTDVN